VVEGARLESEYTSKAYPGFESLSLRQPVPAPVFVFRERHQRRGVGGVTGTNPFPAISIALPVEGLGHGHALAGGIVAIAKRTAAAAGDGLGRDQPERIKPQHSGPRRSLPGPGYHHPRYRRAVIPGVSVGGGLDKAALGRGGPAAVISESLR
jgi:hypothetical protein